MSINNISNFTPSTQSKYTYALKEGTNHDRNSVKVSTVVAGAYRMPNRVTLEVSHYAGTTTRFIDIVVVVWTAEGDLRCEVFHPSTIREAWEAFKRASRLIGGDVA